jgi:hypothetical protein
MAANGFWAKDRLIFMKRVSIVPKRMIVVISSRKNQVVATFMQCYFASCFGAAVHERVPRRVRTGIIAIK